MTSLSVVVPESIVLDVLIGFCVHMRRTLRTASHAIVNGVSNCMGNHLTFNAGINLIVRDLVAYAD